MEFQVRGEKTGIFGIEAEDQPDAKFVQTLKRVRIVWVSVLSEQSVINLTDDFTGFDRYFLLKRGNFLSTSARKANR